MTNGQEDTIVDSDDSVTRYKLYCEKTKAVIEFVGPNGCPMVYLPDGSKNEMVPDEEDPGLIWYLPVMLGDRQVLAAYDECRDKVWWNRHQFRLSQLADRGTPLTDLERQSFDKVRAAAKVIEAEYDRSELELDDFEWGLLNGRLSALAWVLGSSWEESLDT